MDLEFERLPQFCSFCQNIGHSVSNCIRNSDNANKVQPVQRERDIHKFSLQYVPKVQKDREGDLKKVPSSAADKGKQIMIENVIHNETPLPRVKLQVLVILKFCQLKLSLIGLILLKLIMCLLMIH